MKSALACVVLHNYLCRERDQWLDDEEDEPDVNRQANQGMRADEDVRREGNARREGLLNEVSNRISKERKSRFS